MGRERREEDESETQWGEITKYKVRKREKGESEKVER